MILVPCVATETPKPLRKNFMTKVADHVASPNGSVNGMLKSSQASPLSWMHPEANAELQLRMVNYTAPCNSFVVEPTDCPDATCQAPLFKAIDQPTKRSIIVGWGYLLGITFAVTDIPYLLDEGNSAGGYAIAEVFYRAFKSRYGSGIGGIICLGVVGVAIFFCAMSSVTSNSRMAYAFSRDGAMPLSSLWHKVNGQEVPLNAVWLSAFISFCMALTRLASDFLSNYIFLSVGRVGSSTDLIDQRVELVEDMDKYLVVM